MTQTKRSHTIGESINLADNARRASYIYTLARTKFTVMTIDNREYKIHWDNDDKMFYYVEPHYKWEQTHEAGCRCHNCARVKAHHRNNSNQTPAVSRRNRQMAANTRRNIRTINPKDIQQSSRQSSAPIDIPYSPAPIDTPYSPPPTNSLTDDDLNSIDWGRYTQWPEEEPSTTTTRDLDETPKPL